MRGRRPRPLDDGASDCTVAHLWERRQTGPGPAAARSARSLARKHARNRGIFPCMLGFIVFLLIVGLIAGAIARLVVPGRDPMGVLGTMGLGVVGSFVGGFLQNLVFLHSVSLFALHPSGIIGSIIGSIIVLLISRIFGKRGRLRRV